MSTHLKKEIETLKKKILSLSVMVEEALQNALKSIKYGDATAAKGVVEKDAKINSMEVEIEEDCLKILALHQPVAIDLRFIVTALKINNDLERVGDMAVNIAERGEFLSKQKDTAIPPEIFFMAEKTQTMLKNSLNALVNIDTDLARGICAADDEVDSINRKMYDHVKNGIRNNPISVDAQIHILIISRQLERIADLATNMAEDVIYLGEGEIVRHRSIKL